MPARLIVNNLFRENRNVYVFYLGYTALGEVNFLPSGSIAANAKQRLLYSCLTKRACDAQAAAIFYVF